MSLTCKVLTASLGIAILGLLLSVHPLGLSLEENLALDSLFKLRGPRTAPSDVIIVSIDDASTDRLDIPPKLRKLPRSLHAQLIDRLSKNGAALIVFDILFDEEGPSEQDSLLAGAIRRAGNVVLCAGLKTNTVPQNFPGNASVVSLTMEKLVPPISVLAQSAVAFAPFPLPKVPVKVRQYWPFKKTTGDSPTLPVVAFQFYTLRLYDELLQLINKHDLSVAQRLPPSQDQILQTVGLEPLMKLLQTTFTDNPSMTASVLKELESSIRLNHQGEASRLLLTLVKLYEGSGDGRYLNFYGPPGTIPTVPYYKVLQTDASENDQMMLDFNGKTVFVGLSELFRTAQSDGFHTVFSQPDGIDISGVEIAATAFANLLEGMPAKPVGFWVRIMIITLWGSLLFIICRFSKSVMGGIITALAGGCYLLLAQYLFSRAGIWLPLAIPLLIQAPVAVFGNLLWRYVETNRERHNIRKAFQYYLPESEVDRLAKDLVAIRANHCVIHGSCLVTDAAHYTSLSESVAPRELSILMNQYYEIILAPVKRRGGIVTDLVADSMLAIWTATGSDGTYNIQVCEAALDIVRAVKLFNESAGKSVLPTRIGLHSGEMSLGNIGGGDHFEYTPVGDVVNTASRIEGLNKYLHTQILASSNVVSQQDRFLTREVGEFLLAGKSKPVVIHELMCRSHEADDRLKTLCSIFGEALCAYKNKCWDESERVLRRVLQIFWDDGPTQFYLGQCYKQKVSPSNEMWSGLIRMDAK